MNRLRIIAGLILIAVAISGAVAWRWSSSKDADGRARSPAVADESSASGVLAGPLAAITAEKSQLANRQTLAELKTRLFALPPGEAAEVIAGFLGDPSKDAATRLPLVIGRDGKLESASRYRVALLDWLGQLDRAKAAEVAAAILSRPTYPEEWALCLRNFAWANPGEENFEFLRRKTEDLIRRQEWREKPTAGYLEAFDVLVHTKSVASAPLLASLAADTSDHGMAVSHAAFMTLDRLMIARPAEMMEQLSECRNVLAGRGEMVAQMIARADLGNPQENTAVARYLLDPARDAAELDAFAAVFPNANRMVSNNLLTAEEPPSGAARLARDRRALTEIESWIAREDLAGVRPWLETIRRRLIGFTGGGEVVPTGK